MMNKSEHLADLKNILSELFGNEWNVFTEHKPHNIDTSYVDEVF